MILQDILYKANLQAVDGNLSTAVQAVQIDSRTIKPGDVFIAIKGSQTDGHQFIDIAVQQGAVAIICEQMPTTRQSAVTYIQVDDTLAASGIIAHNFYGQPSSRLALIGVTGTNGKTTVATLLYKLFSALGYASGLISTVQNKIKEEVVAATHTTPDPIALNALLARMVEAGCTHVFMEVSSHAIDQKRIAGLHYSGGIFTNITHDHLDYHKTFDNYIAAKKTFFDQLPKTAFALTNLDDKRGMIMLQNASAGKKTYSLRNSSDFKGKILDNSLVGLHMMIDNQEVHFRLIGEFNAYNLLAVYGAAVCMGVDKALVLQQLSMLTGAPGRFDYVMSPVENIMSIVDYAHTPDALLNVLVTIKKLRSGNEQVITVVGCGGNRDKTKRPEMAAIACEYSDKVIFTSDNPRNEDPAMIIKDMENGLPASYRKKYLSIVDRAEAIKTAVSMAGNGDIILIAGKGHEDYQEINGVKTHFDDKEVVEELFHLLEK